MKSFNIDHVIASVLQWILNIALIILSIVLSIFLVNEKSIRLINWLKVSSSISYTSSSLH